ncbi:hypothetical protein GOP47_0008874, partial [Adiantum capillus-veneris]
THYLLYTHTHTHTHTHTVCVPFSHSLPPAVAVAAAVMMLSLIRRRCHRRGALSHPPPVAPCTLLLGPLHTPSQPPAHSLLSATLSSPTNSFPTTPLSRHTLSVHYTLPRRRRMPLFLSTQI